MTNLTDLLPADCGDMINSSDSTLKKQFDIWKSVICAMEISGVAQRPHTTMSSK